MSTKAKIASAIALIGGVIVALSLLGHKSVHAELVIPAPPEAIWSVLTDAAGYKDWNPVFTHVEGEYREGAKMAYQMRDESGKETPPDEGGKLVIRKPWPSMLRTLWGDDQRFIGYGKHNTAAQTICVARKNVYETSGVSLRMRSGYLGRDVF